jgi:ubiquinone/menaquinone biosynthesis C-methylase UbiE
MSDADSVRELYNEKARAWRRKYDVDGPLAHRVAAFEARLAELVKPPAPVLDFGCGTGNLAFHLTGRGYQVTACDIAERMLEEAREAFPAAKIDWRLLPAEWKTMPFATGAFEAIVSSSVFEYLVTPENAFAECARVLKPGGVLVLSVPNPENAMRMMEGVLQLAAVPLSWMRRNRRGRWAAYLDYLALSRNRFSDKQWEAMASRAGLTWVDSRPLGTPVAGYFLTQSPLMLLTFRR